MKTASCIHIRHMKNNFEQIGMLFIGILSSSLTQFYPQYLSLGFLVTCGVKMMSLGHG
jgi:hypothetical protein